jgi:heptosyltransferase-2
MVAFYSALSGEQGVEQDRPQLRCRRADRRRAARTACARRLRRVRAGAEYGPAKRWPRTSRAGRALDGRRAARLGQGGDLCEQIARRRRALPQPRGQDRCWQAFALIARRRAVVSNDSGLMHVAAAFGVPQVAVFGSSSPLHTPPLNDRRRWCG